MALSPRTLPRLQDANLASLSCCRAPYRTPLSGLLLALRTHPGHAEILCLRFSAAGPNLHRRGDVSAARQDDPSRPRARARFQSLCSVNDLASQLLPGLVSLPVDSGVAAHLLSLADSILGAVVGS